MWNSFMKWLFAEIACCGLLTRALQPQQHELDAGHATAHKPRVASVQTQSSKRHWSVHRAEEAGGDIHVAVEPNFDYMVAVDGFLAKVRELPAQEHLWPYPAKVGVVILLFIIFEYLLDVIEGVGLDFYNYHSGPTYRLSRHEVEKRDDPTIQRSISVLTLNVWVNRARENSERQIHSIRELAPDVVCLQEMFHTDVLEAYRSAFPDYRCVAFGRAHNASALLALVAIMLMFAACFSGAVWLVERYAEEGMWRTVWLFSVPLFFLIYTRLIRHHWTIAFLTGNRTGLAMLVRRDSVEIEECSCETFSRMGHAADFLNVLRPRGFINVVGLVRLPGNRSPVRARFVTTHLNQPLEQALGDGRHRQIKEVMQRCLKDGELLIIGCDLNATPPGTINGSDCNSYQDCVTNLEDAWAATNPSDPQRDGITWDQVDNPMSLSMLNTFFYGPTQIRWRCDYIFWRFCNRPRSSINLEEEPWEVSHPPSYKEADVEPQKDQIGDDSIVVKASAPSSHAVTLRSCTLVFTGNEAVSDHFGVHSVFDIRDASPFPRGSGQLPQQLDVHDDGPLRVENVSDEATMPTARAVLAAARSGK